MALALRIVDEFDGGLGWITEEAVPRTSHALRTDDGVWLVDPVDPGNAVLRALGAEIRGVIQLLDRHNRDCEVLAERYRVRLVRAFASETPLHAPFETLPVVRRRWWREVALWWPSRRVLVCADALGTLPYFRARGEPIGVHPLLRLTPPRRLGGLEPQSILVGHGEGVHAGAGAALAEALRTSRRRAPAAWFGTLRRSRRKRAD